MQPKRRSLWRRALLIVVGATLFQGTGLFRNEPRSMVYTVLSGDDIRRAVHAVRTVDAHAFINTQRTPMR